MKRSFARSRGWKSRVEAIKRPVKPAEWRGLYSSGSAALRRRLTPPTAGGVVAAIFAKRGRRSPSQLSASCLKNRYKSGGRVNAIQAKPGFRKHRDVLLLRAFSSPGYNQHDGINKLHGVRRVTFTYDGLLPIARTQTTRAGRTIPASSNGKLSPQIISARRMPRTTPDFMGWAPRCWWFRS